MADSKTSQFLFCETLVIPKKAFLSAEKTGNALAGNCCVKVTWRNPEDPATQYKAIDVSDVLSLKSDQKITCSDIEKHAMEILRNIYAQLNE